MSFGTAVDKSCALVTDGLALVGRHTLGGIDVSDTYAIFILTLGAAAAFGRMSDDNGALHVLSVGGVIASCVSILQLGTHVGYGLIKAPCLALQAPYQYVRGPGRKKDRHGIKEKVLALVEPKIQSAMANLRSVSGATALYQANLQIFFDRTIGEDKWLDSTQVGVEPSCALRLSDITDICENLNYSDPSFTQANFDDAAITALLNAPRGVIDSVRQIRKKEMRLGAVAFMLPLLMQVASLVFASAALYEQKQVLTFVSFLLFGASVSMAKWFVASGFEEVDTRLGAMQYVTGIGLLHFMDGVKSVGLLTVLATSVLQFDPINTAASEVVLSRLSRVSFGIVVSESVFLGGVAAYLISQTCQGFTGRVRRAEQVAYGLYAVFAVTTFACALVDTLATRSFAIALSGASLFMSRVAVAESTDRVLEYVAPGNLA